MNNELNNETLSLEDLGVQIDELQNEDALGIPELGATGSVYSCTSHCSTEVDQ